MSLRGDQYDCIGGHILLVSGIEGQLKATWCLWCGTGTSNEHEITQ